MENLKVKPLTKEQIIISLDRLTRFKNTEDKYLRVFFDILTNNLIEPKYKKTELELIEYSKIRDLAEYVMNFSMNELGLKSDGDLSINEKLYNNENQTFKLKPNTQNLLRNKIDYKSATKLIDEDNIPINLKWLKSLANENSDNKYLFPLKKIVICEGITEETLLPEFAKLVGCDFNSNGIYVISAGGKNKVVKLFYKLVETLKLPIFVLLDSDAQESYQEILPKLRDIDKIYILNNGEFEDILPINLIKKAIAYSTKNISLPDEYELANTESMVKYLEDFYKHRGFHEFKKSEFAQTVKLNIKDKNDISEEIIKIISQIIN